MPPAENVGHAKKCSDTENLNQTTSQPLLGLSQKTHIKLSLKSEYAIYVC